MEVIKHIEEMKQYVNRKKRGGATVGLVPTMGYLHEGHTSLIEHARRECDLVILSIFVNPLQFGPTEDYDQYPKDFAHDRQLADEYGVDAVFVPHKDEMYPSEPGMKLTVVRRTDSLCGAKRPGHFDGVVTVLTKLFNIINPDRAYFGMKDAQQVAVVDDLIDSFNFPIELVACPTVREHDGLAKSSRNVNLSAEERKVAPRLYEGLVAAREAAINDEAVEKVKGMLYDHLGTIGIGSIDYAEILSYPQLEPVEHFDQRTIIAVAYRFQHARLIDNVIIEKGKELEGETECIAPC